MSDEEKKSTGNLDPDGNHDGDEEERQTGLLPNVRRWRVNSPSGGVGGTSSLGDGKEIILLIRGMVERVVLGDNMVIKLGRFEAMTRQASEVDLTPYGALDRGVSRFHAQLHVSDGKLYVTDMGSTNGTYLGGQKLPPNTATLLRKGDELVVGRLTIQILFR